MTPEVLPQKRTEDLKLNGSEKFDARHVKFDNNFSVFVLVPQTINASDEELSKTISSFYSSLIDARNNLSIIPSRRKSNGRLRSVRERRDIIETREKQSRNIRQAIEVFRGTVHGVVELIPTLNKETNIMEASGFMVRYEKS